jgi:hypothetical protein
MLTAEQITNAVRAAGKAANAQLAADARRQLEPLKAKLACVARDLEAHAARLDRLGAPAAKGGGSTPGRGLAWSSPGRLGSPPLIKAAPPGPRVPLLDAEAALRKAQAAALVGTTFEDEAADRADFARSEADKLALLKARLAGPGRVSLEEYARRGGLMGKSHAPSSQPPTGTRVDSFESGAAVIAGVTLPPHAERRARLEAQRTELERRIAVEGRHPRLVEELQTNMIARKLLG